MYDAARIESGVSLRALLAWHTFALVATCCSNVTTHHDATSEGGALDGGTRDTSSDGLLDSSALRNDVGPDDANQDESRSTYTLADSSPTDTSATDSSDADSSELFAIQFSIRHEHGCAVMNDGSLWCWGRNTDGQLGDGTQTTRRIPVRVLGLGARVLHVSAGDHHTCAVLEQGSIACWGSNRWAQLGDGTQTSRTQPAMIAIDGRAAAQVESGSYHTCARMTDGTVWCWGTDGASGKTGTGTSEDFVLRPMQAQNLSDIVDIDVGNMSCAINASSELYCWGDASNTRRVPTRFVARKGAIEDVTVRGESYCVLFAGADFECFDRLYGRRGSNASLLGQPAGTHTCVLIDHELKCWGHNGAANLGRGDTVGTDDIVLATESPANVLAIQSTPARTLVLTSDGQIAGWGHNTNGALGNGQAAVQTTRRTWVQLPR